MCVFMLYVCVRASLCLSLYDDWALKLLSRAVGSE